MRKRRTIEAKKPDTPSRAGKGMAIEGSAVITAVKDEEAQEGEKPAMARFTMTANSGSPMKLQGWKYPVVLDMEGIEIPSQKVPIRMGHDPMMGVGHTEMIGVKDGKLLATGVISRSTDAARDVRESAKNGFPWQASVGASADDVEFVKKGERGAVNGQEIEGPVNIARKSTLGEISFVDLGADPHTDAMIAVGKPKGKRIAAAKDGEDEDEGLSASAGGSKAAKDVIIRAKAERERQGAIKALAEEYSGLYGANLDQVDAIIAKALEERWTIQDTELGLLRETRAKPRFAANARPETRQLLEAALFMGWWGDGGDEIVANDRDYGPGVAQEAWQHRRRGLKGTICAALESVGVRVPHGNTEFYATVMEHQQRRIQAAAGTDSFSTVNLPGILGNVANKVLLEAFTRVDATYDRIAEQADFSNFYQHSIFRLQATGEFQKISSTGEIKHGTLEQDAFSNKLDTSALMLGLTRQQIINDDLNSFRSLTAQLARRARLAVEKALYLVIAEASDVFYTAARGNRLTGTPLDITGLGAAEAAMLGMVDANGDPIYAQPRFVIVPSTLKFMAEQIWSSQLVNDFTTGKARPTDNPYRGRFEPISSPFLNAVTIPGNSATTWYLVADPLMLPAFQVAYLDGRRAPTIESADALFNVLGIDFRCYWDFGVAQLDSRGAVKATA